MKRKMFLGLCMATFIAPVAMAQYPQLTEEAKQAYQKMMSEERRRSDEAWAKALPVVQKEAREGRPYISWASRPYDLPQARIPAFPGAEGGGMYSFGGRGGKVITVTNLNDRGPGSFREACETGGARIIVFNVSGIIKLESPIIVRAPYVTIAGQTAPGDGVCIAGESFWVNTHDVVVRHMRFRRGETKVWHRDDSFGGNPIGNIMIDHCSCTWGLDENISFYRHMYDPSEGQYESKDLKLPTVNVTIQNTISAKALDTYNHAFGSTLGGENCAFMRNLWASNSGRNPSVGWNGVFNFVNNVVFNWVHRSSDGGDYTAMFNMINNYYKPGPATPKDTPVGHRILKPEAGRSMPVYVNSFIHTKTVFGKVKVYTSICFRITGNYFSNKAWRPVNKLSHRTHQISQRIRVRKGKPASITIQHITNYIYLHTCRIFICRYFLRVEEMYLISSINHRIELRFRIERKTNDITVFCIFHRLTRCLP